MKEDEKKFFKLIYTYCSYKVVDYKLVNKLTPRDIINIINPWMHHKRCWYLLRKWSDTGFYDYGVTLDLGWIYSNRLPERYKVLVEE